MARPRTSLLLLLVLLALVPSPQPSMALQSPPPPPSPPVWQQRSDPAQLSAPNVVRVGVVFDAGGIADALKYVPVRERRVSRRIRFLSAATRVPE